MAEKLVRRARGLWAEKEEEEEEEEEAAVMASAKERVRRIASAGLHPSSTAQGETSSVHHSSGCWWAPGVGQLWTNTVLQKPLHLGELQGG